MKSTCSSCHKENVVIPQGYNKCLACLIEERDKAGGQTRLRNNKHEEDDIQEAFFRAARMTFPKLDRLLFAVPNGGKRNSREAARMKRQGVTPGVSDIICLVPNNKYSFLCMETKTEDGTQTDHQKEFQWQVEESGGLYVIFRSASEGIQLLKDYLQTSKLQKPCKQS